MVACQWNKSSPTGPAEHCAGGSLPRSCNSLLIRFKAIFIYKVQFLSTLAVTPKIYLRTSCYVRSNHYGCGSFTWNTHHYSLATFTKPQHDNNSPSQYHVTTLVQNKFNSTTLKAMSKMLHNKTKFQWKWKWQSVTCQWQRARKNKMLQSLDFNSSLAR